MIKEIPTLENERVKLLPLTLENYMLIWPIAQQPELVKYSPGDVESKQGLTNYVEKAIIAWEQKSAIPFLVFDKVTQTYAGTTRFMHIDWNNKTLHIGATWLGREFHGSGLNTHMKKLMLPYAFDKLGFEKIEFRIDARNTASRKAVEKLGAVLEGVLRKNVYLEDGFKRDTCCYGILKEEYQ